QELRNAKVREDRFTHLIARDVALIKQNVGWLDITVNHAFLVGIINGAGNWRKEVHNIGWGRNFPHTRGGTNVVCQRLSLYIIHDHVGDHALYLWRIRDVEVVNLHNVGMVQGSDYLGLTFKTRDEGGVRL